MHRIESLEITGFKSFRNKVRVHFAGDISAIVGPNGCGKSNICDAFLWVMGEQNARSLRGLKMDDVIFNGTQRFGPQSVAEVTLHLKYIPVPGEEESVIAKEDIEICRRLYRDGQSEYFLNGRRCRLMDIQERFEGTGLGFSSYAILEQNRIQDIITSKPMEKRALLEDAARIVTFKHRKKAALVKLDMARNNLLRIGDIISEIEKNIRSLKVQVARARRYRELREEMRAALRARFVLMGRGYHAQYSDLSRRADDLSSRTGAAEGELRDWSDRLARARGGLVAEEQRLQALQEELGGVQLALERITTSQGYLHQQRASFRERAGSLETELARVAEGRDQRLARQAELEALVGELEKALEETRARFEAMERLHREKTSALASVEQRQEELRRAVFEGASLLSSLRNEEGKLLEQDRWVQKQKEKTEADVARYGAQAEELRRSLEDGEAILETLQQQAEELEERAGALREELDVRRGRRASLDRQRAELEKETGGFRHRLRSIEELEARRELYSDTVKKFLPALSADPSFRGTLADFLEAGDDFEPVIESYLRTELEALVASSPELVARGVQLVREGRGGTCRFVLAGQGIEPPAAGRVDLAGREGVIGLLLASLRLDEEAAGLLRRLVPSVDAVWLVRDWQCALALSLEVPGASCLSLDGVLVDGAGAVTVFGASSGKGILGYRREKKELLATLKKKEGELADVQDSLETLVAEIREQEGDLAGVETTLQEFRLRRVRQQDENRRREEDFRRYSNLVRTAGAEQETAQLEAARILEALEKTRGAMAEAETAHLARQTEYDNCREGIQKLKDEVTAASREYADARAAYSSCRERSAAAMAEAGQVRQALSDLEGRERAALDEKERISARLAEMETELASFGGSHGELETKRKSLEDMVTSGREAHARSRADAEQLEKGLDVRRQNVDSLREEKNRLDVERARLESELAHLEDSAVAEFHHGLASLSLDPAQVEEGLTAEDAQARYLDFRDRLEKLGTVNLLAVEEYDTESERLEFNIRQRQDIVDSIESTRKAIEEIDRRSVRLFRETFEKVNANFQEVFAALFGGGFCEMRLLDEENILDSGVDIVAQPPGKKLQNILLLSGGEKALTALALLLAIFRYRPSPFCLLDEVDAPLDDSNIDRFVSLVKSMSRSTQYILITHSKRTMEIADTIYGVTMEEPGVSKVLSVQLRELDKVLEG